MKKTIAIILIIFCVLSINTVFATDTNTIEENNRNDTKFVDEETKAKYVERYGSDAYWVAGYIIEEVVQPYSIPLCFAGIAIGLVFQYVMGTRRLDYKHRGFGTVIIFVTILVICQVLPFIYALVVTGWRG